MTEAEIARFARRYGDAWAGVDSDAFVNLFTDDATYRDDQVNRFSRGHAELRAFHQHFVAALSDIRMVFSRPFGSDSLLCLEWVFSGRHTGTYHGRPPTNLAFTANGVSVLEVTEKGLIRSVVDYYDSGVVRRQLGTDEEEMRQ